MTKYKISGGILTAMFLVAFALGIGAGIVFQPAVPDAPRGQVSISGLKTVEAGLPAVDTDGNGVVGKLITTIRPGTGRVLVNVNDVLAQFDTQLSGRTAAKAASEFTKMDLSGVDIIYDIQVNASVIEGPSAGAAMAASIVLGLEDIPSTDKIMMTGTINENGTIGPIGGVLEKATAAKGAGAQIFLVPDNQGTELRPMRQRECSVVSGIRVCRVNYIYSKVDVGEAINLTVKEVSNIGEVIDYFRQSNNGDISA